MTHYAIRGTVIVLLLYSLAINYLVGANYLKTVGGIYTQAWFMLLNIELCVMQLINSNYPHQRRLFIFLGILSFISFCLLVRSFLLKDKGGLFDSKYFSRTTIGMLLLMAAESFLFRIYG